MRYQVFVLAAGFMLLTCTPAHGQIEFPVFKKSTPQPQIPNQLTEENMPIIGVWQWNDMVLQPGGYKSTIEQVSMNSPFNLLIPFLRFPDKEVVDEVIHRQMVLAADYAVEHNIGLVPDLDLRSARRAFISSYPDELQEMLRLQEVKLEKKKSTETIIASIDNLNDHYAGGKIPPYNAVKNNVLRVYAYKNGTAGIEPKTLSDITQQCRIEIISEDSVRIIIPPAGKNQPHACAMVSFTLFYPDIFGPHLIEFQKQILQQYSDARLSGVCKDEWGFPPYFPRFYTENTYDFWYSKHSAEEYARKTGGRELLSDCLLMARPMKKKETERQVAVNNFMEMVLQRNILIENSFYDAVKEIFGKDAAVTVHPTWWPYPDFNEFKKNGLDWWGVKRDWAQTDEIVPFAARTALSKKWDSPLWYNMYYTMKLPVQVWSSSLAGGRINYLGFQTLYDKDLMRAENRIRLLNYISKTPLDCPVAVVFGHAAAVNWAGPYHNDVGMKLADTLWFSGYPADLIPTSEIENCSLKVDNEGWICYGKQKYSAVVLYNPEFEKSSTAGFFLRAAGGKTALFRIGNWTRDFDGNIIEGNNIFPSEMITAKDYKEAFPEIMSVLKERKIVMQTPARDTLDSRYFTLRGFNTISYFPPTTGSSRLIDGTVINVAGTNNISGDTILKEFEIGGNKVSFDAIGIAAVRLDLNGNPEAIAAGSLKSFRCGNIEINLNERLDLALWIDQNGQWRGVIQGLQGTVPQELLKITRNWKRIGLPEPPAKPAVNR